MAKKRVREYTCDTCGATEHVDIDLKSMPKGWLHVVATNYRHDSILDRDLCPVDAEPLVTLSKQLNWEERVNNEAS